MKTLLITGGTGFIGKALAEHLYVRGYKLYILTRDAGHKSFNSPDRQYITHLNQIPAEQPIDVIINLAGEPLNSRRWNSQHKNELVKSRLKSTLSLVYWLQQTRRKVELFLSASAIGWYGHRGQETLTENSLPASGFSHNLCEQWEDAALEASAYCERLAVIRIGIVLEADGGPLKEMLPAFKLGLGGKMGSGQQYWSWIHRHDLIRLMEFIIQNPKAKGVFNGTAPTPLPQREFASKLASSLNRPGFMPMPSLLASLVFGEFAREILLNGQKVIPARATALGFDFDYNTLDKALEDILSSKADEQLKTNSSKTDQKGIAASS